MDLLAGEDRTETRPRAQLLERRADALLARLRAARRDLRAVEAEATWMVRETESALGLALALLAEERSQARLSRLIHGPAAPASPANAERVNTTGYSARSR